MLYLLDEHAIVGFPCLGKVQEGITFNKVLEARTPCAMVMYVMTPPVDTVFVYVIIPLERQCIRVYTSWLGFVYVIFVVNT